MEILGGQRSRLLLLVLLTLATTKGESEEVEKVDSSNSSEIGNDETEIMESWFQGGKYDKRVRPNIREGPIQIEVSIYVLDFIDVDEEKQEFTIQLYLRQNWEDKRLGFETDLPGISSITLNAEDSKKLWIPDTFITNERRSKWHDVTVENEFTRISKQGQVQRSIRLTVTAGCDMDFSHFPFDTNVCSLEFESYGHTMSDYFYKWKRDGYGNPDIGVPIHSSHTFPTLVVGQRGSEEEIQLTTGSYSRLSVQFIFQRSSFPYIRDVYLPTAMMTFLTFITLTLGSPFFRVLTSLLTLIGMLLVTSMTSDQIPSNSITNCLHWYIGVSYLMIIATILVNVLMYHMVKWSIVQSPPKVDDKIIEESPESEERSPNLKKNLGCEVGKYILPILYLIFNFCYWIIIYTLSQFVPQDQFVQLFLISNKTDE